MRTEELIADLSRDLAPVRRLPPPGVLALRWLAVAVIVVAAAATLSAVRHDLAARMPTGLDLLQLALVGLVGVLAAFAAFQLSFPDRDPRWGLLPLPALGLWLAILGWGCVRDFDRLGPEAMRLTMNLPCLAFILGFGLPLSLAMAWLARHAAVLRPGQVAPLAGMAGAAIADIGLTLIDERHASAMVLAWHGTAILMTVAGAALAGPWLMRRSGRG